MQLVNQSSLCYSELFRFVFIKVCRLHVCRVLGFKRSKLVIFNFTRYWNEFSNNGEKYYDVFLDSTKPINITHDQEINLHTYIHTRDQQ